MKAGLANCTSCKKAVKVKGGPEPLFWIIFGGAAAACLFVSLTVFFSAGPLAGALVAGALVVVFAVILILQ